MILLAHNVFLLNFSSLTVQMFQVVCHNSAIPNVLVLLYFHLFLLVCDVGHLAIT